ncbi:MAG: PRC-barrel domain-containing protein [Thermomicrobiales bacterium]
MSSADLQPRLEQHVLSATTIIGDSVVNAAGEDLGKIEELMIDLDHNRVAYAVLSFGGFLGIGDKLFAVPMESLALDQPNHEFILDVDRETLEDAPGFDEDNWPDTADREWGANIYAHYGQEPYWSQ